jgi:hypothetical protein
MAVLLNLALLEQNLIIVVAPEIAAERLKICGAQPVVGLWRSRLEGF